MVEYADFVRAPSEEEDSDDVEMLDAAPLRRSARVQHQNGTARVDSDMDDDSIERDSAPSELPRFIIAIDFGTTFSSVAYVRLEPGARADLITAESIKCIDNFPNIPTISADLAKSFQTVPTELLCSTQKGKKDLPEPVSDSETTRRSLELEWDDPRSDDTDQESEQQHTSAPNVGADRLKDSIWGWGVHARLERSESLPPELIHLTNFKLQLDENNEKTKDLRDKSTEDLATLRPAKAVDAISKYLEELLRHTKTRLAELDGLQDDSNVEFVLCVPTSWTDRACRIMQEALTIAVKKSGLVTLEDGMIKDLFLVAESEAAATFALEDRKSLSRLTKGDAFLLLDCGGGTVDAVTYELTLDDPVRMKEVVNAEGVSCGSSLLNQSYRKLLQDKLKHAEFVAGSLPLETSIANAVQVFERTKRSINILDRKAHIEMARIDGLKAADDRKLGFRKNTVAITWDEMYEVFKGCLRGVSDLMIRQLNGAKGKNVNVDKVILTGGFGESPSLKNHLKKILRKERNLFGAEIDFEASSYVESAVARGAVSRALRKEYGPDKITRSSYGVLRSEHYDESNPKHKRLRASRDRADGELYIMNTIQWLIDKETDVKYRYTKDFRSTHMFKLTDNEFICEEVLYVASEKLESGYKAKHWKNKGKVEEAGRIKADLTFLKTNNLIEPTTRTNERGKLVSYYEVEFDIWLIIEGRNLRFEVRSPIDKDKVSVSKDFCIAAAFVPGAR